MSWLFCYYYFFSDTPEDLNIIIKRLEQVVGECNILCTNECACINRKYKKSSHTQRSGFCMFECFRQKFGLIFCKHISCIGFPHGTESKMSKI